MQSIMIASSKGGIGKSTAALGIASALARRAVRVLLCDMDLSNPCLDMLTGAESSVIYTAADAALGRCDARDAAIAPCNDSLFLLAAPPACADAADASLIAKTATAAAKELECEVLIFDTGAGISTGAEAAAGVADRALIIAGHSPISVRSAEVTAQRVRGAGVEDIRLIINSFDKSGVCGAAGRKGIFSITDASGLPLFGVVPYDHSLTLLQEGCAAGCGEAGIAFDNIARRLMQENVPLFSGMKKMRRMRNKFYK